MVDSLKIVTLRSSKGPKVTTGDFLLVRYQGNLVNENGSNGDEFDANFNFSTFSDAPNKTPLEFQLGTNSVIKGWEEGLLNRRVGEVVELTIPSSLGYGSVARDKIPANSRLRFKVEILGAFTTETFAPESKPNYTKATLQNLGIDPIKLGLRNTDLLGISGSKVGLSSDDVLVGKDIIDNSKANTSQRDLIIGLGGNDRISGGLAGDFLIGGLGRNTYVYSSLDDSRATDIGRDKIYGFSKLDKIDLSMLGSDLSFSKSRVFSGTQREIVFSSTSQGGGVLRLDWDGNKSADLEILLVKTLSFSSSQLVL